MNWGAADRLYTNPEHDSLFVKFEQLEKLLDEVVNYDGSGAEDALKLVKLIRAQVLK